MAVPAGYYDYAAQRESGGDPNAQNPLSSASGLYQFINSTRADVAKRNGIDPSDDSALMKAFTSENAAHLQNAGYAPTTPNLYLAHRFGPAGAVKALGSAPGASAASVFPANVMQANPDLQNKNISDLTGNPTMAGPQYPPQPDPNQGALNGQQVAGGPGALFGGQTPVGMISNFLHGTVGLNDPGRNIANAGAALRDKEGAAMTNANNMPLFRSHFSVGTDPYGNQYLLNGHSGQRTLITPPGQTPGADGTAGTTPKAFIAGQEALAQNSQKEYQASQDANDQADATLGLVANARNLVNNPAVSQGAAGELKQGLKLTAKNIFGIDLGGVDQGEALSEISNQLKAANAKAIGMKNYAKPEIQAMGEMGVNENRPQAANLQALDNIEALAKRTKAQHAVRTQYMKENGGILGPGVQGALDKANLSNPAYPINPAMQPAPGTAGRPSLQSIFAPKQQ